MAGKTIDLANSPSHLLRRCQQVAFDLYTEEAGRSSLTQRQLTVLRAVEAHEGVSQTTLVAETGIDRSTLADMIQRMIAKDLLARKRTEDDLRANAVRITPKGAKALKGAQNPAVKADQRLLELLPASKRAEFLKMLALIAAAGDADGVPAARSKAKRRKR